MRAQTSVTVQALRARFHPLFRLRRNSAMRALLRAIDIRIWTKVSTVEWNVRVRLVRHAVFILVGQAEPSVVALFRAIAREIGIQTFWDVGANVGYYSWLVKSTAPGAEVRMFEPDADNLALIRETLDAARLSGVYLRPVAVSDHVGRDVFVRDDVCGSTGTLETAGDTFPQRHWRVAGTKVLVDTVSLDKERELSNSVDLVKVDVEGHEEAVIRGARSMIAHDQPILIFECFHGGAEIVEFLTAHRYSVGDAERPNQPVSVVTSNFVALPERLRNRVVPLAKTWAAELELLGRSPAPSINRILPR
jgi:FkbM family methyltransferase